MSETILLTAAKEDSARFLDLLEEELSLEHYPLECYKPVEDKSVIEETLQQLSEFENIIYGSLLNARYFIEEVRSFDQKEGVRNRLNLTMDEATASFLEESGVPAVCTYAEGKSINLIEFLLRIRRFGPVLYPCGSHQKEEIPGFLEELDIPVKELELFDLKGPDDEDLELYRQKLSEKRPDIILFHSRRSVNRTLVAFPDLQFEDIDIISADKGVSRHLSEKGLTITAEAEGSWESIADLL